jgi:hypothetical protein
VAPQSTGVKRIPLSAASSFYLVKARHGVFGSSHFKQHLEHHDALGWSREHRDRSTFPAGRTLLVRRNSANLLGECGGLLLDLLTTTSTSPLALKVRPNSPVS